MTDSVVIGAPGVLTAWVHMLVREAAIVAKNSPEIRTLDRPDDADFLGQSDSSADRIFLCNFPNSSLVQKVASGTIPVVAVFDEPSENVRVIRKHTNWPFDEVLRACTLAHTINRAVFEGSKSLVLHRGMEERCDEIVDSIFNQLGLILNEEAHSSIKQRQFGDEISPSLEDTLSRHVSDWMNLEEARGNLSSDEAILVSQILTPMVLFAFEEKPPKVVWSRNVFFFADKPGERLPVVADLTGGARNIFYGPYLYLPPGYYVVRFIIGFTKEVEDTVFKLKAAQLLGTKMVAEARCKAPGAGVFEGVFRMHHTLSHETLEIVLSNIEGAIDGRIALAQIDFELLPAKEEALIVQELIPFIEESEDFK